MTVVAEQHIDPRAREIYVDAMTRLMEAGVDFLVDGAYAYERYTGIARHTKDFDIFLTHEGTLKALQVLGEAGYVTEMTFPHWLGKAYPGRGLYRSDLRCRQRERFDGADVPVFNVCYPLLKRSFPEELPFRFYDVPSGSEVTDAAQPEASAFTA